MEFKQLVKKSIFIKGTTRDLAAMLGCTERTVYRWLAEKAAPSAKYIKKMQDLLLKGKD
jgi:predicted DNA-binding transcriptional regulator AlpA